MEQLRGVGHAVGDNVGGGRADTDEAKLAGDVELECHEGGTHFSDDSETVVSECHMEQSEEDSIENAHPLLLFYDCEATGFSIYDDHITEIAAKVVGVPLSAVSQPSFSSLVHIPRNIPKLGEN